MRETPDRRDPRTPRARALRRDATPAERRLWRQLNRLDLAPGHFRRQAPIGPYVADFAHHRLRVVVELDGAQHGHDTERRRDERRTAYLESLGYRVIRFWNEEIFRNLDGVVETILAALPVPPRSGGEGRLARSASGVGGAAAPGEAPPAPPPAPVRASGATRPSSPQAGGGGRGGTLSEYLKGGEAAVLVTIVAATGSTPREAGAAMAVTLGGTCSTIGGGQLEYYAIDVARVMLARGEERRDLALPLGPLLGQCCGGHVVLSFERSGPDTAARLAAAERRSASREPTVLVFGCGHTGLALAGALAPLPLRATLVDDRLDPAADPAIPLVRLDDPATAVRDAPAGAAFVILTHSHALDYRLADAALRRGDAAYVGMIGSATKRRLFERSFVAGGGDPAALSRLTCPIGGSAVRDKRPAVIAALVAAELVGVLLGRPESCRRPAMASFS